MAWWGCCSERLSVGGEQLMREKTRLGQRGRGAAASAILLLALLLAACANSGGAAGNPQTNTQNLPYNISVTAIREFPVLTPQSGLMRPAVDSAGNIWFGE